MEERLACSAPVNVPFQRRCYVIPKCFYPNTAEKNSYFRLDLVAASIPVSIHSVVVWERIQLFGRIRGVRRVRGAENGVNRTILSGNRGWKSLKGGGMWGATEKQDTYFAVDSSSYLVFKSKSSAWVVSSAVKDGGRKCWVFPPVAGIKWTAMETFCQTKQLNNRRLWLWVNCSGLTAFKMQLIERFAHINWQRFVSKASTKPNNRN